MMGTIFWDITPCNPLKADQRFGGTDRLHLQGQRISRARYQRESKCQAEPGAILGLFFDPEDSGDIFLQNIGSLFNGLHSIISQKIVLFLIVPHILDGDIS
jgi:hypothetical protein